MAQNVRQIRQFTQTLFDGFLNRDIAPRIIHSALPKALYDVEILSASPKTAALIDKFGLFYLVCDLCYLALSLHNIAPGAGSQGSAKYKKIDICTSLSSDFRK